MELSEAAANSSKYSPKMAATMTTEEILAFFENVRIKELGSFRSLCNALKAYLVKEAVDAWRTESSGRISVLDLGCGRGGDLRKWASYRLRSFLGLDGGTSCVEEARLRHAGLVAQGKSTVHAVFHVMDVTQNTWPLETASVNIVSSMFFLQFCFSSRSVVAHVLDETSRVLHDNGVLCCILPDGNRVASLLPTRCAQACFGHFRLQKCKSVEGAEAPFGLAYNFALTKGACTEYAVSARLLQDLLLARGFVGAGSGGCFFEGAQQLLSRGADSEVVSTILHAQKCSQLDWVSLGFFTVLLAKKKTAEPVAAPEAPKKRQRKSQSSQRDVAAGA
jgi:SAM-dependent methyltransferase